jgi:hypothetical protein
MIDKRLCIMLLTFTYPKCPKTFQMTTYIENQKSFQRKKDTFNSEKAKPLSLHLFTLIVCFCSISR